MKTILKSLAVIVAIGAITGGATFAYFTDSEAINYNKLTAGTVKISLDDPNGTLPFDITNMAPGDQETFRLDVLNEGSLAVDVSGTVTGVWDDLDTDKYMNITGLDYYDEINGWTPVDSNVDSTVEAGKTLQIRLVLEFDKDADNAYQGKTYRGSFIVNAIQSANR